MISNYKDRKSTGLVSIEKAENGEFQATKRRFSEHTGFDEDPLVEKLDIDQLRMEKSMRESQVVELDALIKDFESL